MVSRRLALEPLLEIRVGGDMLGQDLDGDGAGQAGVGGSVDLAHAARAEGGLDLVGAEGGVGLKGHEPVLCEATGVKDQQTDSVAQFPELVHGLRMPLGQQ